MAKRILALFLSIVMLFTITVSAQSGGVDGVYDLTPDTSYGDTKPDTGYVNGGQDDTEDEQQPECTCGTEDDVHAAGCALFKPPMMMMAPRPASPVTAGVYTLDDVNGTEEYTQIVNHGPDAPLDMKNTYNDQTIYVLASESDQNVYFKCGTPWGIGLIGAEFSLLGDNASWVPTELAADGKTIAGYVTVSAQAEPGTEIMLTAKQPGIFGEVIYTVYIQVLEELPEEVPVVPGEVTTTTETGHTIKVSGNMPENISLEVSEVTDTEKATVLNDINSTNHVSVATINFCRTFDLKMYSDGREWQPAVEDPVTITLSGGEGLISKFMLVNHILDTETAIQHAISANKAVAYKKVGLSALYPRETAAVASVTGEEDTIYYTEISNEGGDIAVTNDGGVEFQLDSFSEIQVVGYELNNIANMPTNTATNSGGMVLDKNVEWVDGDNYKLILEAYSTGQKSTKATDVVFIIDQSCSMYSPVDPEANPGSSSVNSSAMTVSNLKRLDMSKLENQKAGMEGYYVAVFHSEGNEYYVIPVRYKNGTWQRTAGDGSYALDKWVSQTIVEVWNDTWVALEDQYENGKPFTIYKSVYGAAYDALEAFVDTMEGENGEGTPNCRAGIVGFSCPSSTYSSGPMNTGIYINGSQEEGLSFTINQYENAFNDMSTTEGIASFRKSMKAIATSGQTTTTDAGFMLAREMLKNASVEGRDRVVILFTDGKPEKMISTGYTANEVGYKNAAIATANTVKDLSNTTVYTYGIVHGSITDAFLKALSSSYPNATSESELGTYEAPQCWGLAGSSSDIQNAFSKIAQEIVSSSVVWDSTAKLKDIISDNFKLPTGTTKDNIIVKTADWNGNTFETAQVASGLTTDIIGDNTVDVYGFDYSANYITQGVVGGKKLIVEVPIVVDRTVCKGGNDLPTNTTDSAIWSGQTKVAIFPIPEVDVMTIVSVKKTVVGNRYAESFDFTATANVLNGYSDETPSDGGNGPAKDLIALTQTETVSNQLSDGQSFDISNVKVGAALTIAESNIANYDVKIVVKKNGATVTEGVVIDQDNGKVTIESIEPGMTIEFTNTWKRTDLTIKKEGSNLTLDPNQTFIFTVNGKSGTPAEEVKDLQVVVNGDGTVVVKDVPVGDYTVTEDENWSWRYDFVRMEDDNGTITDKTVNGSLVGVNANGNVVTVTNTRDDPYWLDGNTSCQNVFDNSATVNKFGPVTVTRPDVVLKTKEDE